MMLETLIGGDDLVAEPKRNDQAAKRPPGQTNAERWQTNTPAGPEPPSLHAWAASMLLAIVTTAVALAAILACVSVASAGDAVDDRPVLYFFSQRTCTPCDALEKQLTHPVGLLREYSNAYRVVKINEHDQTVEAMAARNAWLKTIPADTAIVKIDQARPAVRYTRPGRMPEDHRGRMIVPHLTPILWVDGRRDYWQGYTINDLNNLSHYLEESLPISPVKQPPKPQPKTEPDRYERPNVPPPQLLPNPAPAIVQPPAIAEPEPEPEPATQPPDPDFDGLTIVLMVASLTDGNEPIRATLARRANASLQQLAREHIGDRVQTYLISEVGDKDTYERLVETIGIRPGVGTSRPVAALVLIPERLAGLKGMLIGKVEQVIAGHYMPELQQAGVMPILERIHGDTYSAVIDALVVTGGGTPPDNRGLIYIVATYLSERSKLAEWIARKLGYVA